MFINAALLPSTYSMLAPYVYKSAKSSQSLEHPTIGADKKWKVFLGSKFALSNQSKQGKAIKTNANLLIVQ